MKQLLPPPTPCFSPSLSLCRLYGKLVVNNGSTIRQRTVIQRGILYHQEVNRVLFYTLSLSLKRLSKTTRIARPPNMSTLLTLP